MKTARVKFHSLITGIVAGILCIVFLSGELRAQSIIRDTETENTIRTWFEPVVEAADMNLDSIRIILVKDSQINAFVAGGPNIFIYSGLILYTETPGELIGVLAHELGHISGGHLVRGRDAMEKASYESLLGSILGIGTALLTGDPGAGTAITSGFQSTALRRYLAHSRVQESSADQAALTAMEKAGYNPEGLTSFLRKLQSREDPGRQTKESEYLRTHPLTENRIRLLENAVLHSEHTNEEWPEEWTEQHSRMKAKLMGYIHPEQVVWAYDDRDLSVAAEYARAVADYRMNRPEEALGKINALIEREPQNPFFYELKGQMLFDFGRIEESIAAYEIASRYAPESGLIKMAYAHALIEEDRKNTDNIEKALSLLKQAELEEQRSTRLHRLLATAYGIRGRQDMARLHLAEEAVLKTDWENARDLARRAKEEFAKGSREWLKADDLLRFIEQNGKFDEKK